MESAKHIFKQCKETNMIAKDVVFSRNVVDISVISDDGKYYGGLIFSSTVAERYFMSGRRTAAAHAAQCDGVKPQSYETTFEVVTYDTNNHVIPIDFGHSVGPECYETWCVIFEECKRVPGFDTEDRTTLLHQKKCIRKAYEHVFDNVKLFLDPVHVKRKLGDRLGAKKAVGLCMYDSAVWAPTKAAVEGIIRDYSSVRKEYLNTFPKSELFRAYSHLEDTFVTSPGAESQMVRSLREHIRAVEPQKMLFKGVLTQREGFLASQAEAIDCATPVPQNAR